MSEAAGAPWTPPQCQRVWRFCAYGIDIGALGEVLPDSDGEDAPVACPAQLRPVSDGEVAAAVDAMHARVAAAAAEAARGAGSAGVVQAPALPASGVCVQAAGLPPAAHAVVHEHLLAVLGPAPARRTALDLCMAEKRGVLDRIQASRVASATAAVAASTDASPAHGAPKAARTLSDAIQALDRVHNNPPQGQLQRHWESPEGASLRATYAALDEAQVSAWAAEARSHSEQYQQLYRSIALQPALLELGTRAG